MCAPLGPSENKPPEKHTRTCRAAVPAKCSGGCGSVSLPLVLAAYWYSTERKVHQETLLECESRTVVVSVWLIACLRRHDRHTRAAIDRSR